MRDPGWYAFRLVCWIFSFGFLPWLSVVVMVYKKPDYMKTLIEGSAAETGKMLITISITTQVVILLLGFAYSLRLESKGLTVLMRSGIFIVSLVGFLFIMGVIVFAPEILIIKENPDLNPFTHMY